ncbi:MAG: hypothetical protein J6U54_16810 [Clostridiales bacterium]|nr:hypothetical protein [Clostridiales bacterium]
MFKVIKRLTSDKARDIINWITFSGSALTILSVYFKIKLIAVISLCIVIPIYIMSLLAFIYILKGGAE